MVETKNFQKERPLREFLKNLWQSLGDEGKKLGLRVDAQAFANENPDVMPVLDVPVRLPASPKKLSLAASLAVALGRVPINNATYFVSRGYIEITTYDRAYGITGISRGWIGPQTFQGPLEEVLDEMAEITGHNILIDPKVKDKVKTVVKAKFINKVEFSTALAVLTEMAGLSFTPHMDMGKGIYYVTTKENAKTWLQMFRTSIREQQQQVLPARPGDPVNLFQLSPDYDKLLQKIPLRK
jgi:hypothetical protein